MDCFVLVFFVVFAFNYYVYIPEQTALAEIQSLTTKSNQINLLTNSKSNAKLSTYC